MGVIDIHFTEIEWRRLSHEKSDAFNAICPQGPMARRGHLSCGSEGKSQLSRGGRAHDASVGFNFILSLSCAHEKLTPLFLLCFPPSSPEVRLVSSTVVRLSPGPILLRVALRGRSVVPQAELSGCPAWVAWKGSARPPDKVHGHLRRRRYNLQRRAGRGAW